MRTTRPADLRFAYLNLQRRHQCVNEMELTDRANVLAEAGSLENAIHHKSSDEIAQDDPGSPAWAVPKRECLVRPQVSGEQAGRDPLGPHLFRPPIARRRELSSKIAGESEWTCHAKKIAGHQQRNHR